MTRRFSIKKSEKALDSAVMQQTHRPCVSIVLLRLGKDGIEVLLVHKPRKNDAWQIPQGGIEEGESIEEAAKRELLEETGIVLQSDLHRSDHHYEYNYPPGFIRAKKPRFRGQHLTFLTASVPEETVVKVDHRELDTFKWISPSELRKYLKRKEYREVVEKVIREVR